MGKLFKYADRYVLSILVEVGLLVNQDANTDRPEQETQYSWPSVPLASQPIRRIFGPSL
jgi:hypothetical protein